MQSMKHFFMYVKLNSLQIKRKWLALPLLLLSPIILVGIIFLMVFQFMMPDDKKVTQIGIVDLDQSMETEVMIKFLTESEQLGPNIKLHPLSETEADEAIKQNDLSAYIVFPEQLTDDLYTGNQVILSVVGNEQQRVESLIVKEIVDSVMRHINTSQANILLINEYARDVFADNGERNDYIFEQFLSFFMYALSKDNVLVTEELTNAATSATKSYYTVSAFFVLSTLSLFIIFHFLYQPETKRMTNRMKLYGVTELQQLLARMTVTIITAGIMMFGLFFAMKTFLHLDLLTEDYLRIVLILVLYSFIFLNILAVLDLLFRSEKIRFLLQTVFTLMFIVLSGAIIPTVYFPVYVQDKLHFIFSTEALHWLQEILLNERFYVDYQQLLIFAIGSFVFLFLLAVGKERVK